MNVWSHSPDYHPGMVSCRERYRTIDDRVVRAAYRVVFLPKRKRYVTGGVATQFYCKPEERRGSDDIDVTDLERLTWTEFREEFRDNFFSELADRVLMVAGPIYRGEMRLPPQPVYQVFPIKKNHSYVAHYCNLHLDVDEKFCFDVEFPRQSARHHEGLLPVLEREYAHATIHRSDGARIRVLNPVDIVARKLLRVMNYYEHEGIPAFAPPADIQEHLCLIWERRKALHDLEGRIAPGCAECASTFSFERTKLRAMCDSYDIRLLCKKMKGKYFEEVFSKMENRKEVEGLFSELSPEFR